MISFCSSVSRSGIAKELRRKSNLKLCQPSLYGVAIYDPDEKKAPEPFGEGLHEVTSLVRVALYGPALAGRSSVLGVTGVVT